MGLWSEQVAPRLGERMNPPELRRLRAAACADLSGHVLEIGFGAGLNVAHYPRAVRQVTAVEPSAVARRLAGPRIRGSVTPVRFEGADAAALPFADATFDAALSTLTLCTIPDVRRALREVARVLKPGAALHVVEHGHAPDPDVAGWQRRLEPLQQRVFAGCHLTRDVPALLSEAGFDIGGLRSAYLPRPALSRPWTFVTQGRAVAHLVAATGG